MKLNVCFGCHDTDHISHCDKIECGFYSERRRSIALDDDLNEARTKMVRVNAGRLLNGHVNLDRLEDYLK